VGAVIAPKCVPDGLTLDQLAMTLSLWRDLESVAAFSYRGIHGDALSKRAEWFMKGPWPSYVAWWVDEHHQPTWREAVDRIDQLHVYGSTSAHSLPTAVRFDGRCRQAEKCKSDVVTSLRIA